MTKLQEKVAAKKARPSRSKAAVAARNAETLTKQIAEAQVQLDKLNAVANPGVLDTVAKREEYKPPALTPFTTAEKEQFKARIANEKSNVWKQCNAQPQAIIDYITANKADERNAAVRFARRDALAWALRTLQPVDAPF
jgi:hypothetical protein